MGIDEITLRDICRHHIDSFESWSRRLIDEKFKEKYGEKYFSHKISEEEPLIKNEIKQRIEKRVSDNPSRFPRLIDAMLMDDIVYFLCRADLYSTLFKEVLEPFYSGRDEVRCVLERTIGIRNKLSHGNIISHREVEQCICYTNDFIEVYKNYYQKLGKERVYNVPVFIRVKDCFGNDVFREDSSYIWEINFKEFYTKITGCSPVQLRPDEEYKLWVEVDSSFDSSLYDISWRVGHSFGETIQRGTSNIVCFTATNKMVSYSLEITICLTSKKEWHQHGTFDDLIKIQLDKVLPPIEDSY